MKQVLKDQASAERSLLQEWSLPDLKVALYGPVFKRFHGTAQELNKQSGDVRIWEVFL